MVSKPIFEAYRRLRSEADGVIHGFPATQWERIEGPGPDHLELDGAGNFRNLVIEPGKNLTLKCRLQHPTGALGVELDGDSLEATLFTLYPITIRVDGKVVLEEGGVPVAAGPSLFTLIPNLSPGTGTEIEMTVRAPKFQTTTWLNFHLTTSRLRKRFEALDVAWAQLSLAEAFAADNKELERIERAVKAVPPDIQSLSDEVLGASLGKMAGELEAVSERIKKLPVHLIGHSHIDMNWMWTWPDTVEVIRRDVRSVLALMDQYPELTFSHSQPATYEVIREREPSLFEKILKRIEEGRWETITATWIEGDTNMASGEAMARQLLEGVTYTRQVLHSEPKIFHAPDTFGHAGNLPQLAVSAGIRAYYHHRCNPGQANQWPAYWWEGQDGSRLLGISTYSYNGEILARDLAGAVLRAKRFNLPVGMHFHGIGDHGGGPSRQNLEALRRFQKLPLMPGAFCSTMEAYTDKLLQMGTALPTHRGESSTIFEGCYTTHADTKRMNRQGENLMCTADTLAVVSGTGSDASDRHERKEAWRKVLFNQFHDILDGSAIHETYEKNAQDFTEVEDTAERTIHQALSVLHLKASSGDITVTNPLGWEREDWVTVPGLKGEGVVAMISENGHTAIGQYDDEGLGFVARVPAFGTAVYRIDRNSPGHDWMGQATTAEPAYAPVDPRSDPISSTSPDDAPYYRVETPHYRAYVRRDSGIIVSLFDKRVNQELIGFGLRRGSDYIDTARPDLAMNVFQVMDEYPHGMTAWQMQEVHTEHSLIQNGNVQIGANGPSRCILEVKHQFRDSAIAERICFYRDIPRIDFNAEIDWKELGSGERGVPNLKVAFTANLLDCESWFEAPFAAVRRPANGQEVPALRWAAIGGSEYGVALLNDSKYAYDALGCRLRMSLVRSAYDPDAISDVGKHSIRFSLLPYNGDWRQADVVKAAAGYNQSLLVHHDERPVPPKPSEKSPFIPELADQNSALIAGLKYSEAGDGCIIRLYESGGLVATNALQGLPERAEVWETNLVEDRIHRLDVHQGKLELTFHPWQVRTLLVIL